MNRSGFRERDRDRVRARRPPLFVGLLIVAALSACAARPPIAEPGAQRAWLLAGAGELQADLTQPIDAQDLLVVTDEMHDFAVRATARAKNEEEKIRTLVEALHSDDGLALRYDALATLTAQEAFKQRRANCITHTLLFIAMARDLHIDARFNQVDVPPIWDLRGDSLVLYRHINARIGASTERFRIVDLTPEEYDPAYRQRVISDREAEAQFFNNRAVDLQTQGQHRGALRYQLRALELSPDASFLWSNLGHLYLALGNLQAAETSIGIALKLDTGSLSAYGTATRIYEALGEPAKAQAYRRRAEWLQRRNPYYHYQLAQRAYKNERLSVAYQESLRAIKLYPQDHRFFLLMGAVLARLDRPDLARKSIEAAIALTGDEKLQSRYRSKLDRIAAAAKAAPG